MKRLAKVALVYFSSSNLPILALNLWNELKAVTNGKVSFELLIGHWLECRSLRLECYFLS